MLAEKLLLQLLITLSPVIIHSVFLENKRTKYEPILCGLIAGTASVLCMIFTYENYEVDWDLRYVSIILVFLYCGPLTGGIAVLISLVSRSLMDGGNLLIALIGGTISIIAPLLVIRKFKDYSAQKRIHIALITGMWPLIVSFMSLILVNRFQGPRIFSFGYDIFLLALVYMLSIGLSAILIENFYEKKQMKAEIDRTKKLNTLGELAASIAHEVRNPLTVVKGFLQLMKQEENGKNFEYLALVLSELGRAETIINDYLNFSKPKFEKIEQFQLITVLKEIILLLDPLAMKKGVQIESELNGSDVYLMTDRNQLKQALVNFIKNAIEATEQGGKVLIRLNRENNLGFIYISDTGKGMTKDQLSRIGTLFYTTKDKGTGLGTSVSIRIIETMKGKVTYKSEPGIGTEVKMALPIS